MHFTRELCLRNPSLEEKHFKTYQHTTSNFLGQNHALADSGILCGKLMSRPSKADLMSAPRKRETRLPKGPREAAWKTKVNPSFVRFFREVIKPVADKIPQNEARSGRRLSRQVDCQGLEELITRLKREFGMPQEVRFEHLFGPSAVPEIQCLLPYLVGFLYFEDRPETLVAQDAMGNRQASYDLIKLNQKVTAMRYMEPIKPPKTDVFHRMAFMLGWKAGLWELKPRELASCFDEICPLHEVHDPDNLRKQRARAARAIAEFEEVFYTSGTNAQSDDGQGRNVDTQA